LSTILAGLDKRVQLCHHNSGKKVYLEINLRPQLKSAISKQKKDDDKSKTRKNEDNQKIKELKKSKTQKIKDSKNQKNSSKKSKTQKSKV
jgi:hypothetical protein